MEHTLCVCVRQYNSLNLVDKYVVDYYEYFVYGMPLNEIVIPGHTHTVCVPYYKAAPYNISHTKIFSRAKYNRVI